MKLLEERILEDGEIASDGIVRVDSFLNHQLDISLLDKMGEEIYNYFKEANVTKILTIEASGIPLAVCVSRFFGNIPVVFAKKTGARNMSEDVYESEVKSYTYNRHYIINVSKEYITPKDNVLIIDDFLAEGHSILGLISIVAQGSAKVAGISVAIEKSFQKGGKALREMGYDLFSLARIEKIKDKKIYFKAAD